MTHNALYFYMMQEQYKLAIGASENTRTKLFKGRAQTQVADVPAVGVANCTEYRYQLTFCRDILPYMYIG